MLEDDGLFSFPAGTQANGFTSGALGGRTVARAETEGDAALVVSVSRSSFYNPAQPLSRAQQLELQRLQMSLRAR